jgi:hypothetical protein
VIYKLQWRTWELFCYSQFALATETKAFATSPMDVLLQLAMAAASGRSAMDAKKKRAEMCVQEGLQREDRTKRIQFAQ